MLGTILNTLPFDIEVADEYACRVYRLSKGKLASIKLFQGAMGELAVSRWDGAESYARCIQHLRTASEGNLTDFRFDFVDSMGRQVDPKSNSCDLVFRGYNSLLVTEGKARAGIVYVSLDAQCPSCRTFEFTGFMLGEKVATYPVETNKQTGGKYHKVPTGYLTLPSDWRK